MHFYIKHSFSQSSVIWNWSGNPCSHPCCWRLSVSHWLSSQAAQYTLKISELEEKFNKRSSEFNIIQEELKIINDFLKKKPQMEQELKHVWFTLFLSCTQLCRGTSIKCCVCYNITIVCTDERNNGQCRSRTQENTCKNGAKVLQ